MGSQAYAEHTAILTTRWTAAGATLELTDFMPNPDIGWLLQTKALIMIIFANVLLDRGIITNETFTALLLMAVGSTMLTIPLVKPRLRRLKELVSRSS